MLCLLKRINARTKCVVQMTLTTDDEDLCRVVEPNVATTFERFQVLETMRDEGIPTVGWLSPILPFINDTEENLDGILDYCRRAKVHAIQEERVMVSAEALADDFFKLRTGLAGSVLQRFINYNIKVVVVMTDQQKV
jgi:DNA repair photolyase